MTVFYLDTSALVKRYKTEAGSAAVDHLYENLPVGSHLATSFLTVLEFVSAIRRLLKSNSISNDEFEDIVSTFSHELEPFICDDEELINAGRKENLDALNPRIKEDGLKLKEILERLSRS